jgi:galactofuranosylgalactofuranosylrhamnosyl-N-acetylglucosaminyl-diphospho-decaprenol beta-1,5/1,6-galactofuranosyltransferase
MNTPNTPPNETATTAPVSATDPTSNCSVAAHADPARPTAPDASLRLFQSHSLTRDIARMPLYFKKLSGDTPVHALLGNENSINLSFNDVVSFDTYFNTLFEHYTTTETAFDKIVLSIKIKGKGILEVFRFATGKIHKTLTLVRFDTQGKIAELKHEIALEKEHVLGSRISFHLTGLAGGCSYHGGGWFAEQKPVREVVLNAVICTYKKLRYLDKIVNSLLACKVLDACQWNLIIVDNASEIEKDRYQSGKIHIYPQKNSGGAGGFTRGIMESVYEKQKGERKVSHVLLMDDDIELNPECVFNTIRFLEYVKNDSCVGGGMIDMDKGTILHEHGADIGGQNSFIHVAPRFHDINLADSQALFGLSRAQRNVSYNAWWFYAFPISCCETLGLPMPCFIRGDDQEYGLRLTQNGVPLKTPPGIALWHEPFEAKHAGWTYYFGIYNNLIIAATRKNDVKIEKIIKELEQDFILNFLHRKNYVWALTILGAIEDFLLGPDYFMHTEPFQRMERARSFDKEYGPPIVEGASAPEAKKMKSYLQREMWRWFDYGNRGLGLLTALGWMKKQTIIDEFSWHWSHAAQTETLYVRSPHSPSVKVYHTNIALYNEIKKKTHEVLEKLKENYPRLCEDFKKSSIDYNQFPFWENYLGLNK